MSTDKTSDSGGEVAELDTGACKTRFGLIEKGGWRSLESFWNALSTTCFFQGPASAQIKVRYGVGWLGKDGQ